MPFWCRADTNPGSIDAFIASSAISAGWKALLEREEGVHRLARSHFVRLAAVDEHLAGARARIVIRGHGHRVGPRRQDREKITRRDRELAVFAEDVGGFADRAHHVVAS